MINAAAVALLLLSLTPPTSTLGEPPDPWAVAHRGHLEAEQIRIRGHLGRVLGELDRLETATMTADVRARRARHLEVLRRYRDAGVFPQNRRYAETTPIFIDEGGRACAVGHLLLQDGQNDVVNAIVARQNLARVPDITVDGLLPWAAANGFTVAELARIQPSYEYARECEWGCRADPCGDDRTLCEDEPRLVVCDADGQAYRTLCVAQSCDIDDASSILCGTADQDGCSAAGPGTAGVLLGLLGWTTLGRRRRRAA